MQAREEGPEKTPFLLAELTGFGVGCAFGACKVSCGSGKVQRAKGNVLETSGFTNPAVRTEV